MPDGYFDVFIRLYSFHLVRIFECVTLSEAIEIVHRVSSVFSDYDDGNIVFLAKHSFPDHLSDC